MSRMLLSVSLLVVSCLTGSHVVANGDWMKTWVMESDTLPTDNSTGQERLDFRWIAAVGNGDVATVLYSPTVYMNGLYNGPVGWTHRAAIQSVQDIVVSVEGAQVTRMYALDMWRAVFTETISTEGLEIKVMTYAHQRLVQLLVSEIHVTRTDGGNEEYILNVERSLINSTIDLAIDEPTVLTGLKGCSDTCKHTFGHTFITETDDAEIGQINIYWTDIPPTLHFGSDDTEKNWTFVSSYDKEQSKAFHAFQTALNLMTSTPDLMLQTHEKAWANKWNSGRIDVEGDDDLATVIHSSLYYILMSLPSSQPELPLEQFCGLSPGSLARGANWTDYQGHVFWDMDTWMFPPILALFPDLARDMLSYRIYGGEVARAKAREHGYEGWQFPWESAFTGYEMTPLVCVPCRDYELHITGDIAFAARQYWAMTRDRKWLLQEGGINLIVNTATFWVDRAEYNQAQDRYEINGVMPPDEYAEHVNNSIYTNYVAKINIELADYVACLAGQQPSPAVWERRQQVARKLYLAFNESSQHHPEYEGYDNVETAWKNVQMIKQADVVLLGYPLGMKMPENVRRNDLELYTERTNPGGPALTWSMFTINWLDIGELDKAAENFHKSYAPYARKPFNTWSESKSGITDTHRIAASNFISGMGGFLQAVVFGYAGLRIELEHLTVNPHLPPNTHKLKVTGINYLEATFDLLVTEDRVLLVVRETSDKFLLQLKTKSAGTTWVLRTGMEVVLSRQPFEISSLTVTECPMSEGSSCPDVVTVDNSSGTKASLPGNVAVVHVSQTGGDRCRDFLLCSQVVRHHRMQDDSINFYIGDDNRVYQGSSITTDPGTLKVALLGDYTLSGMTIAQEALLRRLIKCGMESKPAQIEAGYKLHYDAELPENCGSAPCAGNSLHCQLMHWSHWDQNQVGVQPDCSLSVDAHPTLSGTEADRPPSTRPPGPTPDPQCPPVQPAEVTCNCQTQAAKDVSSSAPGVISAVFATVLLAAAFCFEF